MQMETKRLVLRDMTTEDFPVLLEILSDPETMRFYPEPFDEEKVRRWIDRNRQRYREDGFGLWTVLLKQTGEIIGDCGITMQPIRGKMLPEIGYHIHKRHQRNGYASEAAKCCMDFLFEEKDFSAVYSYMKYTNAASYGVALKNGMRFIEEYDDPVNIRTRVYGITRDEWRRGQIDVETASTEDLCSWMELVCRVKDEFPGLETKKSLCAHADTVVRFMKEGRALCVRDGKEMAGLLLYSKKRNMICFLAVCPQKRRRGIATALLKRAVRELDDRRDILVTTFRENDPKGLAPRTLYRRFGFTEGKLGRELDYPVQELILKAKDAGRAQS